MTKKKTSMALSPGALQLQRKLAKKLGVNLTSVIEMAIREMASRHGIEEQELRDDEE